MMHNNSRKMFGKILLFAVILVCAQQLVNCSAILPLIDSHAARAPVGTYFEVNGKQMFMGWDFVGVPLAWSECNELGMSLLSIESATEFEDLINYLRDNEQMYNWFWTSGVRDAGDTRWYWNATQQDITDTFWASGQPNDQASAQSCLQFNVEPDTYETWFDKKSDDVIPFICQ